LTLFLFALWATARGLTATAAVSPECADSEDARIWISPANPAPGDAIRIMAVTTDAAADGVMVADGRGAERSIPTRRRGGPPWSLEGETAFPASGSLRLEVRRGGDIIGCREIAGGRVGASQHGTADGSWTEPMEAFYSAWIEKLFDAPDSENLSFKSLEPVLRDEDRNFLFNHLGVDEDRKLPATPDCADLPYFLRTYFAWKIGLPVAFRACDRGTAKRPSRCGPPTLDDRFVRGPAPMAGFNSLMRQIADTVHSGSARTALTDEATDFYPIPLDRQTLWPGTVYADPYGHTLIIAKWSPQLGGKAGTLYAVDAQPDNSVARKRFWQGNFLFADTPAAGPGFKAFRPILMDGGRPKLPGNTWLAVNAPVAPYSEEQDEMNADDFYAAMGKAINPQGQAPEQAYDAMLDALLEQLETRVEAVNNGETYLQQHRGSVIPMPSGAAIFETIGPWEDYATPSRDMRLLIALNVLSNLPEQITRYPELFSLGGRSADDAKADIEQRHERRIHEKKFSYRRSDGSSWELSVADIFARRHALEMGYNPNQCVEERWGAPADSAEHETCTRHAPPEQRTRMSQYRDWFKQTQRPPR
jgi:hypothetical protein